ncbi:MAG: type II secretion system F family protein [Candidatus Bilamarchaeaceae archaeon]
MGLWRKDNGKRELTFLSDLPFLLKEMGLLLKAGLPFERCLSIASEDDASGTLAEMNARIANGRTVGGELSDAAKDAKDQDVKRCLIQLSGAYTNGDRGDGVSRIGEDLLQKQRAGVREYASKLAVVGLVFLVAATVLPTFFIIVSQIGKELGGGMDPAVPVLVLVPALLVLVTLVSVALGGNGDAGWKWPLGLGAMVWGLAVFAYLTKSIYGYTVLLALAAGAWALMLKRFSDERREERIEENLPDALLLISKGANLRKTEGMFRTIQNGGFGPLSEGAGGIAERIGKGLATDKAITAFTDSVRSRITKRAFKLLDYAVRTNAFGIIPQIAEDALAEAQLKRERRTALSMQRYSLMFGAAVIPVILAGVGAMGSGISGTAGTLDMDMLIISYLVVYSAFCSAYISILEGRGSAMPGLFTAMAALSAAIFCIIKYLAFKGI